MENPAKTVLSSHQNVGPKGVGDPEDTHLRKVEREILIPKLMRERTRNEKCRFESEEFGRCCADAGLLMTFKCKPQTKVMYECMETWYKNDDFIKECTEMYLKQRSEYRSSGLAQKMRAKKRDMF